MAEPINGARALAQTLVNCGVEVCFANPGTIYDLDLGPDQHEGHA
jgi:hypothetical protein